MFKHAIFFQHGLGQRKMGEKSPKCYVNIL